MPSTISMGAVTLRVANLDQTLKFYRDALGLETIATFGSEVVLGRGLEATLVLQHSPEQKHASPSDAGLFHTALLYDTREALANAVASVAQSFPKAFTGSADHLVSEAFYFDDPEGNGVELYVDRAKETWSWQDGQVQMATLGLDPNAFLQEHVSEKPVTSTGIGHVHLSVGNIEQAKDFYVSSLGFDVTMNWSNTALFVSAGGYHHHMAMNIWKSRGAGMRQQTLGLGDVAIELPDNESLAEIRELLKHRKLRLRDDENVIRLDDPWGNQITLKASLS